MSEGNDEVKQQLDCGEVNSATVAGGGGALDPTTAKMREFTNENLLKFDTYDKYSTANSLKKHIVKTLNIPAPADDRSPLFEGMTRLGKNPKSSVAFFAFSTPEAREAAKDKLVRMTYRANVWEELEVRKNDLEQTHKKGGSGGVKRNRDTEGEIGEGVSKVCPYADVPYEEQIARKRKHCHKVYKTMCRHQNQRGNMTKVEGDSAFQGIISSPVLDGYRNNVTLSCGVDKDGVKAIGFNAGTVLAGEGFIEPLNHIPVNPMVKGYVDVVSSVAASLKTEGLDGLENVDATAYYSKLTKLGFWRKVQVRNNVKGDFMLDIEFNVPEPTPAPVKNFIDNVIAPALIEGMKALPSGLCSLQYHCYDGVSMASTELIRYVMHGASALDETLCGLKFDVAPTAFFQVNIPATELMMKKVAEEAKLTKDTILLDLCCGTGTIGICLSDKVRKVVGVEMVPDSIENAKINAARNNVENCTFHCGKVEDVLLPILQRLEVESGGGTLDVVAILDPPRCGVHPDVVRWIRRTSVVKRLVYISCDQRSLERDSEGFLKPATQTFKGSPFALEAAVGVDLFPHTEHQEMFAVMRRVDILAAAAAVAAAAAGGETTVADDVPPPVAGGDK